jgi:predicted nucleotidyltransferase
MASRDAEFARYSGSVILRCVVGSRAHGLDGPASDTDRRGIYLAPVDRLLSLDGAPEQIENDPTQECYWELAKFLRLALRANPQVLESLWTPLVETCTPVARELLDMRSVFMTREIGATFGAYAESQLRKTEHDLRTKGAIKWKHAMHIIRLLLLGAEALRSGELRVHVGGHRERLVAIKEGRLAWPEVDAWRRELVRAFESAFETTTLPAEPDRERVDAWLIRVRRDSWASGNPR